MDINYAVLNSAYKHKKYVAPKKEIWDEKHISLWAARKEEFAFQVMLQGDVEFLCYLYKENCISWKGHMDRVRLELSVPEELKETFSISFEGYVKDDSGAWVADPILKDKELLIEQCVPQMLWIEGKVPTEYKGNKVDVTISMYHSCGFEDEVKIGEIVNTINLSNIALKPLKEGNFYLDLWQHPGNWARMYKVPLWSEEHFTIIKNYLEDLGSMGEKVITAIVSDFPWAGQTCYKVFKNPSNLFEYNMVKVFKNKEGELYCDFSNLDRYINIAMECGIEEEINLFGLLGNWEARSFGNPLEDYKDPIRVCYFDENTESFKYIRKTEELKAYITVLFKHFIDEGLWNRVQIISDEPNNPEVFSECVEFINSAAQGAIVKYKVAAHDQKFLKNYDKDIHGLSMNLALTVNNMSNIEDLKKNCLKEKGKLTWFVCCVPERPNNFICSPLIESRLISWFTYYFNMDGFLRWDYAIWPDNPWEEVSYKYPRWKAGDMFFVYPGKDMKPVSSIRWKNLKFGLQDYMLLCMLQEKGYSREKIYKDFLEDALGHKNEMSACNSLFVEMNYSIDYNLYENIRRDIIKAL